jgi:hypothetical protein
MQKAPELRMQFKGATASTCLVALDHVEDVEQDDDADRHAQEPKKYTAHV